MTASQLVARIRREGGHVWLSRRGQLRADGVTDTHLAELRASRYLVTALLRDEIGSLRWEHSGKDPSWWRYPEEAWSYPDQRLMDTSRCQVHDERAEGIAAGA